MPSSHIGILPWKRIQMNDDWEILFDLRFRVFHFYIIYQLATTVIETVDDLIKLTIANKFLILEGVPGTGKTHFFKEIRKKDAFKHTHFLTFHPSTEYTSFVGGIQPSVKNNKLVFLPTKGHFLRMIDAAAKKEKVLLWIDEINRANIPRVFGDIISILGNSNPPELKISGAGLKDEILQVDKNILDNLHIIGTLNTSDKSVTPLDSALRRRFSFVRVENISKTEAKEKMPDKYFEKDIDCFYQINDSLGTVLGHESILGHSYLFALKKLSPINRTLYWKYKVLPNVIEFLSLSRDSESYKSINNILKNNGIDLEIEEQGKGLGRLLRVSQTDDDMFEEKMVEKIVDLLNINSNVILEGVPGTGKTRIRNKVKEKMDDAVLETVTFHPATTYEGFIGGLFPNYQNKGDDLTFEYKQGVISKFADKAKKNPDKKYILFIDEINRANIPLVLGELMTIIEHTKRVEPDRDPAYGEYDEEEENQVAVHLEGEQTFSLQLPNNLFILATMNTSDRSVIGIDAALRRRFAFYRMETLLSSKNMNDEFKTKALNKLNIYNGFELEKFEALYKCLLEINTWLESEIGPDAMLGHSFVMIKGAKGSQFDHVVRQAFQYRILPQIADTLMAWNKSNIKSIGAINTYLKSIPLEMNLNRYQLSINSTADDSYSNSIHLSRLEREITIDILKTLHLDDAYKQRVFFLLFCTDKYRDCKNILDETQIKAWMSESILMNNVMVNSFRTDEEKPYSQGASDQCLHTYLTNLPSKPKPSSSVTKPWVYKQIIKLLKYPSEPNDYVDATIALNDNNNSWIIDQVVKQIPDFSQMKKKVAGDENYFFVDHKGKRLDQRFKFKNVDNEQFRIQYISQSGNTNPDYYVAFERLNVIIKKHQLRATSMCTLKNKDFNPIPNFKAEDFPKTIKDWITLFKDRLDESLYTKSPVSSISITFENKWKSTDKDFLARCISGFLLTDQLDE